MTAPSAGEVPPTLAVRLLGGFLVLAATALVALVESYYVLLRAGTVRIPLSLVIALAFHPSLTWLMRAATGRALAMVGPFVLWLAVVLPLGVQRAEGDLIVTGDNWVSTVLLFGGSLLFVGTIGVLVPVRAHPGR